MPSDTNAAATMQSSSPRPTSVLFVCLGNICRSPMAEGVFRHLVAERGAAHAFEIDSAGTGAWHVGEPPDGRARTVAAGHGVDLDGSARQVVREDLEHYDYVIAMDGENLRALERLGPRAEGVVLRLLRDYDPAGTGEDVPDPYYGGPDGFEVVYEMVLRSCRELLAQIVAGPASD